MGPNIRLPDINSTGGMRDVIIQVFLVDRLLVDFQKMQDCFPIDSGGFFLLPEGSHLRCESLLELSLKWLCFAEMIIYFMPAFLFHNNINALSNLSVF